MSQCPVPAIPEMPGPPWLRIRPEPWTDAEVAEFGRQWDELFDELWRQEHPLTVWRESYVWHGPDWDLGDGLMVRKGDWLIGH